MINEIKGRISNKEILIRLNGFIISYFGWIIFTLLYEYFGRWSIDVTEEFLKLPLTSKSLVLELLDITKSIFPLYVLLRGVYYIGFAGSIGFMVIYILLYLRDIRTSDELLGGYLSAYIIAGVTYTLFHVYAPHYVYHIPGYPLTNTLLTRQEFVFPSLHNAFAAINIIVIWKYKRKIGAKVLLLLNTLIPFATVFLAHHWIYDVVSGFALGIAALKISKKVMKGVPKTIYNIELKVLRALTVFNVALVVLLLFLSLEY
ncbi:phosphoesterase PAP2 superfamily protein [Pyrococcus sp. ST04]|nr:phosphoesterase PAP2 superfamily protein [Pyrococcus sp. ST04]